MRKSYWSIIYWDVPTFLSFTCINLLGSLGPTYLDSTCYLQRQREAPQNLATLDFVIALSYHIW